MKFRNKLLDILRNSTMNSTNWLLASTILEKGPDIEKTSIKDLATECHVSEATISRFVRLLGCNNYIDFKNNAFLIRESNDSQIFHSSKNSLDLLKKKPDDYLNLYYSQINESLNGLIHSINFDEIDYFLHQLHQKERVYIFSFSSSLMLAEIIQSNLINYGKLVLVGFNEVQQKDHLNNLKKDDLVITLSTFGNFIHEYSDISKIMAKKDCQKVLVTQNPGLHETFYFDKVICLSDKNHVEAGFYTLFLGVEYMVRRYASLFGSDII
ncbi:MULTISPECIES: MurR/RpiR family transcriptional regulator [Lactobacillales]|uniref:MurR/RpiR family transcriptional regulator n=1 Tax=Lactobacillales TaxID=186826 RepID=UPI002FCC2D31